MVASYFYIESKFFFFQVNIQGVHCIIHLQILNFKVTKNLIFVHIYSRFSKKNFNLVCIIS